GQVGLVAARRHAAVSADGGANRAIHAVLQPRRPGCLIADFRRAAHALAVAFDALRLDDLLAAAFHRHVLRAGGFLPLAARPVHHVGDRAPDLEIGEVELAAVRGHLAHALQRMLREAGEPLGGALAPGLPVADLRRAVRAARMASRAHRLHHGLAAALAALGLRPERGEYRRDRDGERGGYQA